MIENSHVNVPNSTFKWIRSCRMKCVSCGCHVKKESYMFPLKNTASIGDSGGR